MRRAKELDIQTLWTWRNDPTTIKNSATGKYITWNEHVKWFNNVINSGIVQIFVGLDADTDCLFGMVRFELDKNSSSCEVSINLSRESRGEGLSRRLLLGAINNCEFQGPLTLLAYIKPQNIPSIRCFEGCGFGFKRKTGEFLEFTKAFGENLSQLS